MLLPILKDYSMGIPNQVYIKIVFVRLRRNERLFRLVTAKATNAVINDNIKELFQEVKPVIENIITKIGEELLFKSLEGAIPFAKLYPVQQCLESCTYFFILALQMCCVAYNKRYLRFRYYSNSVKLNVLDTEKSRSRWRSLTGFCSTK